MSTSTSPSIPDIAFAEVNLPTHRLAGNRQAGLAALLSLALLVSVTLGMWWESREESMQIAHERFAFKLAEAQEATQRRLLAYEQVLRGAVGRFASSVDVTRDEWALYVRTLEIEKNFMGIQGLGFSVRVRPAELAAHRQKIRREGLADYAIQPPGERAEYAPIVYMEPADWRNLRAFGYDMLADPALREPLERARDTGLPSVSGKVKLAQEVADGVQSGFVMCLPVFRNGAAHNTAEQRQAALSGHVCATFRMGDLMQGILGTEKLPNIRLRIFDGTAASPENLMYDTLEGADETVATASFREDQVFDFDGRQWLLRFDSLPAFDATVDVQKPRILLLGGLLVSVLFAAVAWSLLLNRQRARVLAGLNADLETEIAERTKLESELMRARDAAETANQAKSDFLANVSHELRTPLTLILAPLEQLLVVAQPAPDWRAQLDRAQRNALRLMNRVNDILDFSKAEAGKFALSPASVDLARVLGGLADDAAAAARGKGCSLSWHIDPGLGTVCLDAGHFEKIALNLVSNALKFTPAGGSIHLNVAPLDGEPGDGPEWFEFAVEDSGIGIAPDKLPLLFQRFSQIDNSATRQYSGTGIGLALVKELTELMGGEVGVDSAPGRGSRFFVRLPRRAAQPALPAGADSPLVGLPPGARESGQRRLRFADGGQGNGNAGQPSPGAEGQALAAHGSRSTVLIVDDSPDMLSYLSELLAADYDVATAADGEQAWALLQRRRLDLILSDVMMPELDGFGLTARIKASAGFAHLPVILLTARGGSEASVSGLETGADDYIAKPFSPLELKARVRAALRMSQVQAELRDKSRQAGMAEIAVNVLHNVGNVLNSVSISAGLVSSQVRASRAAGLGKALALINEHAADLGDFLSRDAKGKLLPGYLNQLAQALAAEQGSIIEELGQLTRSVEHIREIVASQQAHAGTVSVVEMLRLEDLIDDAVRMSVARPDGPPLIIVREFAELPLLALDRHRLLEILVNLIANARQAMDDSAEPAPRLILRVDLGEDGRQLRIDVVDNGAGIAADQLTRIFTHGYTTRRNGHGFGLHSCALAAVEMGGTLTAHSDGPGHGASFTLKVPIKVAA